MFRDPRAMLGLLVVCAMVAWAMVLLSERAEHGSQSSAGARRDPSCFPASDPRPLALLRPSKSSAH